MALKDLKSDLSKFRRPVEKPLIEKKRVDVPKTSNQTPLSQFVDKTPAAPKSNTTTPKQGVTPNKFDNSSKFLGETNQTKFDNSSKFMGQTDPSKFDNSSKFLGQTDPSKFDNSSKDLGTTTPKGFDNSSKFLGETDPNKMSLASKFLGETDPNKMSLASKFLGETEANKFDNSSKFLGETEANKFDNSSKFLGETDPNGFDNSSKFLGETDPNGFDNSSKFLGETNTQAFSFNPDLESQGKDPKFVDFISNDDAVGFSPFQKHKSPSRFVGVDRPQLNFDGSTSLYGLNTPIQYSSESELINLNSVYDDYNTPSNGISFTIGYKEFKVGDATPNVQRYNFEKIYEDSYNSIGGLMEQRNSPSFLDKMYAKFNLRDDSPNYLNLLRAPYILTGIQRKKISKGEPQFWDFGLGVDDGFIRGGIVASTTRAIADVLRLGSFFLSVKGLLWGVRQFAAQKTNKYGRLWTPINLLASTLGQHIGFKPSRHGLFPGDPTDVYKSVIGDGYADKLFTLYSKELINPAIFIGAPFLTQVQNGGFDSVYGIGITNTTRYYNTFGGIIGNMRFSWYSPYGDELEYVQKYNPWALGPTSNTNSTYGLAAPLRADEYLEFGVVTQTQENSPIPIDEKFEESGLYKSDGLLPNQPDIADYEAISYGTIAKLADNPKNVTKYKGDFRNLKTLTNYRGVDEAGVGITAVENYEQNNLRKTYGFSQTFKTNAERISSERLDKVGLLKPNDGSKPNYESDIVILGFKTNNSNRTQFRGTVSGITETFSPSWNSEKPNGRADKVYMYTEFERTLSFSFKAVAYSRMELEPMWEKLKQLATFAMPFYGSSLGYRGRVLDFTLGDLYKDHKALLTSLSYTMSDDASWELDTNYVLPKLVDISVGLTLVGNAIHSENSTPTLYSYGE